MVIQYQNTEIGTAILFKDLKKTRLKTSKKYYNYPVILIKNQTGLSHLEIFKNFKLSCGNLSVWQSLYILKHTYCLQLY